MNKPLHEMTKADMIPFKGHKFPRKAWRGEFHGPDFVADVYLHEGLGYITFAEHGHTIGTLPGPFDPKAFERAGSYRVSTNQVVTKWQAKRPTA